MGNSSFTLQSHPPRAGGFLTPEPPREAARLYASAAELLGIDKHRVFVLLHVLLQTVVALLHQVLGWEQKSLQLAHSLIPGSHAPFSRVQRKLRKTQGRDCHQPISFPTAQTINFRERQRAERGGAAAKLRPQTTRAGTETGRCGGETRTGRLARQPREVVSPLRRVIKLEGAPGAWMKPAGWAAADVAPAEPLTHDVSIGERVAGEGHMQ